MVPVDLGEVDGFGGKMKPCVGDQNKGTAVALKNATSSTSVFLKTHLSIVPRINITVNFLMPLPWLSRLPRQPKEYVSQFQSPETDPDDIILIINES